MTLIDTKYVAWCNSQIGGMNERFKFSRMFKDKKEKYIASLLEKGCLIIMMICIKISLVILCEVKVS